MTLTLLRDDGTVDAAVGFGSFIAVSSRLRGAVVDNHAHEALAGLDAFA